MRKHSRENNLDYKFRLALYEKMVFKWRLEGRIRYGQKVEMGAAARRPDV